MSTPFLDFRPAEYRNCKHEKYVQYYVFNPATGKLHRKIIRLNKMKNARERKRYAMHLCSVINSRLYEGWNPFETADGIDGYTIKEAVGIFLKEKEKSTRPATMVSYRSYCRIFLEWMELNGYCATAVRHINDAILTQFMEWVDNVHKPTPRTYNNYIGFVSALFGFFVERGIITEAPSPRVSKRTVNVKKRTIIPPEARKVIWGYFKANLPPFCAVMSLCYKCLIRPKEIVMLRMRDIDFDNGTITIEADVAKNHRERTVRLPEDVLTYFQTLRGHGPSIFIFTGRKKFVPGRKSMPHTRISERWAEMREATGLPDTYQFYSLKDTGITEMLDAGVPPKYVKELADHSSLVTTEKYTHKTGIGDSDFHLNLKF